jgi:hypothetical protein
MEETEVAVARQDVDDSIPIRTLALYLLSLSLSVLITANDIYLGRIDQLLLSVPTSVMLAIAIVSDRQVAHIPPLIVILMVITLIFVVISTEFKQQHVILDLLSSILTGVCLMLIGMVFVYTMLHTSPERETDHKLFIYTCAFGIAMTVLLLMFVAQCVYFHYTSYAGFEIWVVTQYIIFAIIGALLTAFLSELGLDRIIVNSGLNRSLEYKPNSRYSNEVARQDALDIISSGESEKLEFKSTLTTNIKTGENDKRMQKAVLKTIVAFLNTSGGILMIGVSDDGSIYGIDEYQFDNRDKMNLHFTNMIAARIGDEFYPYISFRLIDMEEGKAIMRVDCTKSKKPVFLKDGKVEEFYVRSGPSSVELTGSSLVNYITNKSEKEKRSIVRGVISNTEE